MHVNKKVLQAIGERIKLHRQRRLISEVKMSTTAQISRSTLRSIEKGSPRVGIGYYIDVMMIVGFERDLIELGLDDALGWQLQEKRMKAFQRHKKRLEG